MALPKEYGGLGFTETRSVSVAQVLQGNNVNLSFRRSFGTVEEAEWTEMSYKLDLVTLGEDNDSVKWAFEKKGNFSTASLYRFLTFPGAVDERLKEMWETKLPLKIKIFLWQLQKNKIPAAEVLKQRKWKGSSAPQRPSDKTALASAVWRDDEPWPRFASAPPSAFRVDDAAVPYSCRDRSTAATSVHA
ncbi:hypothetical protein EJB05_09311, partial [Eragrostis curvula]